MNTDPNVPQGLDPTAFYLTKAIRQTETGNSLDAYTMPGKSGEYGAYQYTPDTWNTDSEKYLGQSIPLDKATPEQQNQVAYSKISDLLKQGNTQSQVASIWNSGYSDPNTVGTGTNKYGAKYDVPGYVNKVKQNYLAFSKDQGTGQSDSSQASAGQPDSQGYITSANIPSSPDTSSNLLPENQPPQPGFIQKTIQGVASPILQGISSIRGLYDAATGNQQDLNNIDTNGADYGYFGKQKPIGGGYNVLTGSAGDAAKGLLSAAGTGVAGASDVLGAQGVGAAVKGLLGTGGSALASDVAKQAFESYLGPEESIEDMTAAEQQDALQNAYDASKSASEKSILQEAISEAKANTLKEAGIGSWSDLNPRKAKLTSLATKGGKALIKGGITLAGLDDAYNIGKGLLK